MKIGEALKEERLKLGLSIRKMAEGIIDPTFYSRVEQENRNIGSEALVRILFAHEINIDEFFNKIKDTYASSEATKKAYLEEKIRIAFNSHDIVTMHGCLKQVSKLNDPILKLRVIVGIAYLEDKIKKLPHEVVDQIYDELDKNDEFSSNVNAIRLFTNAMPVFSYEQLTYFMHMLLARAKNVENKSEKYDERIAIKDELLELGYAEMVKNWNL
jgi:transcriptional regulator with XRE-family HTH domain